MSRRKKRNRPKSARAAKQDFAVTEAVEPSAPVTHEIGVVTSDPDVYPAFGNLLENPDEVLRKHYARDVRIYKELLQDDEVKTGLEDRALQVTSEAWEIVPAGDDTEVAEFVDLALRGSNLVQSANITIQRMLLYGYHVAEIMPVQRGGRWVIDKFYDKKPWRFRFTIDRVLRLLTKESPVVGIGVPEYKFQRFTWGETDQPYGDGLGQYLYRYVYARKNIHNFWTYFLDKFSSPSLIGKYRKTGNQKEDAEARKNILAAITAIRRHTGVVINESDFLELLEIKDSRGTSASHKDAAEYFGKAIRKIIQLQTLTTDVGTVGSKGMGDTHDEGRQKQKENTALVHAMYLNEVVKWLVDVNFWGRTEYPQFRWITEKEEVQKELAETYETLNNQLKESGKRIDPDFIAEKFNVKMVDYTPPASPAAFSRFTGTQRGYTREQQAIEDHVGKLTASVDLSDNEQKILEFVQGFEGDLEDLPEALLELYPALDMADLQEAAEIGIMNGGLHGRRVVQKQKEKARDE